MKSKYVHFLQSKEPILNQLIYFSFHLVLITYPFTTNLNSIMIIILCSLSLVKLSFTKTIEVKTIYILLGLFFLSRLFSLVYTENLVGGIKIMERSISLLVFPLIFMINKDLFLDKVKLIKTLSISTFLACIYCLFLNLFFFISNGISTKWWFDWKYNNYHLSKYLDFGPNYFSALILVNFLCLVFYKQKLKRLYWVLLGVQLFFLLLLSSRGIILFFVISSILITIRATYIRYKLKGMFFSVIMIFILLSFIKSIPVVSQRFNRSLTELRFENNSKGQVGGIYNRLKKIEASINIIENNMFLGVGIGDVRTELKKQYISMDFKEGIERSFNAHNQYLESLLASGVFGLLSFTLILLFGLYKAILSRDGLYFALISLFLFFGLLESYMETHKGIILATFVIIYFFPYKLKNAINYD